MHFNHLGDSLRKDIVACAKKDERFKSYLPSSMSKCNIGVGDSEGIWGTGGTPVPMVPPSFAPSYPGDPGYLGGNGAGYPSYPLPLQGWGVPQGYGSTPANSFPNFRLNKQPGTTIVDKITDLEFYKPQPLERTWYKYLKKD